MIRHGNDADLEGILEILNLYILNTHHAFDTSPCSADERRDWISQFAEEGRRRQKGYKKTRVIPPKLKKVFGEDTGLKTAFDRLTAYRQREHAEYISGAKKTDTRTRPLEKIVPMILTGKGLYDKYQN